MIPLVKQWLKPGGKLVLTYLSWLPRKTRLPRHPSNHAYEEGIPFTRESWRGRIRACRGIGATFPADEVERFDREHEALLRQIAPETFTILHQVWLHAYTPLGDADTMQASPV
jgi:hypothetical protein